MSMTCIVVSPLPCGLFLNMTTGVIYSVQFIYVSLFTLVTIESQYDSNVFGAVTKQLTDILIYLRSITFL